jgi:hypothetical protein
MSGESRKIAQDARTKLMFRRIINGAWPGKLQRMVRPHMRPHTWVFLRQRDVDEPIINLGIVFHEWPRNKYNMINFTSHTATGKELKTSGLLTQLDNGQTGLVLQVRWPWGAMLREYKGLSAGDL